MKAPVMKIQTTAFQRIGKVILWMLVTFLILRGVGSLFKTDQSEAVQAIIKDFVDSRQYKEKVEFEAASFAKAFAVEYLTYDGKNAEDYTNRLKEYVPGYLESFGVVLQSGMKAEALMAQPLKLAWISDSQLNVDILVKVRYTNEVKAEGKNPGEVVVTEEIKVDDVFIRIPITEKEGRYLVEDYPAYIPQPDKAEVEFDYSSGREVDSSVGKEITGILENFFKTYYSGKQGEIAYYMLDASKEVKGLDKRFEFIRVNNVNTYFKQEENKYFSLVTLTVSDSMNGQNTVQRFHVELAKKDGRFYIEGFDVRVGNMDVEKILKQ